MITTGSFEQEFQHQVNLSAVVLIGACIKDLDKLPQQSPERQKIYSLIDAATKDADRNNPHVDIAIGRAMGAGWGL